MIEWIKNQIQMAKDLKKESEYEHNRVGKGVICVETGEEIETY